jgi:hypothetical protein
MASSNLVVSSAPTSVVYFTMLSMCGPYTLRSVVCWMVNRFRRKRLCHNRGNISAISWSNWEETWKIYQDSRWFDWQGNGPIRHIETCPDFFSTARVHTTKSTIKILAGKTHCKYFLKIAEVTHFFCTRNRLYQRFVQAFLAFRHSRDVTALYNVLC